MNGISGRMRGALAAVALSLAATAYAQGRARDGDYFGAALDRVAACSRDGARRWCRR